MPEVIVIGSGTGVPSLNRASPAILLKTKNTFVLLDSGPGTLRQLLNSTLTPKNQNLPIFGHFSPVISDVPTTFFPISSTRCHWLIKFPT